MFKKILIANRGDQPHSGAAAKLNGMARAACAGDCTPMEKIYV
ncbi:hypothetical protein [Tepidicella xavieri]|jgi:hypothetical protein|uniref:Uncharacterized protein n=1 Tax=Tepidicella xavieri TaxID=360241 RepID=A0A4R6UK07_9BURK|nr:hypothetical protein [Tepidicella xavieri]TDQ43544.1 hypothetical protein DFR43_106117 [Tepidicella xavieri]